MCAVHVCRLEDEVGVTGWGETFKIAAAGQKMDIFLRSAKVGNIIIITVTITIIAIIIIVIIIIIIIIATTTIVIITSITNV